MLSPHAAHEKGLEAAAAGRAQPSAGPDPTGIQEMHRVGTISAGRCSTRLTEISHFFGHS